MVKILTGSSVTRLFFEDLAIYNKENLPKRIQIVPKWVHNFAKYQINLKDIAKDFKLFAKVAKFCQIWSRCVDLTYYALCAT